MGLCLLYLFGRGRIASLPRRVSMQCLRRRLLGLGLRRRVE